MKCSKEQTVRWSSEAADAYVADNGRIWIKVDLERGIYAWAIR
ncbi:hypothetical protein [Paenibacillus guangzhouensis]|nr:hypothetical protein [Paenibacillus guangzhouensis]